jgi:hypothetical protein
VENGKHVGFKFPDGEMVAIDELPEQLGDYTEGRIETTTAAMALGYKVGAGAASDSSTIETALSFIKGTIDAVANDASAFIGKQDAFNKKLSSDFAAESVKLTKTVDDAVAGMTTDAAATKKTLTASVTTVAEALSAKIQKLEDAAKCNFNGDLQSDKKTCKCKTGWGDLLCDKPIPPSCKGVTKTGLITGDNGLSKYCYAGGWELAFNLASTKTPALDYKASFWTEEDSVYGTAGLTADCTLALLLC